MEALLHRSQGLSKKRISPLRMSEWKGAGLVFTTRNKQTGELSILCGIETKYLSDYRQSLPNRFYQGSLQGAHAYYTSQCIELSSVLDKLITYDTPLQESHGMWKATYRICPQIPDTPFWGIPKGKRQLQDTSDKETIQRELLEETGIVYSIPEELTPFCRDRGYSFYRVELNEKDYEKSLQQIQEHEKQRCRELHNVAFRPLSWIRAHFSSFNGISRFVLKQL